MNFRTLFTRKLVSTTAIAGLPLAIGVGFGPTDLVPQASAAAAITTGNVCWGVKESFRKYISSPFTDGTMSASAPATQTKDGIFQLPIQPESTDKIITTGGGIHFTGHGDILKIDMSNLSLEMNDADSATLFGIVFSQDEDKKPIYKDNSPVAIANVEFDKPVEPGAEATGTTTLTADGAKAFRSYKAGEPVDDLKVTPGSCDPTAAPPKGDDEAGQGNGAGEGADNGANNGTGNNNGQGNGTGEGADNGANNGTGNNNGQGNGTGEGTDNGANNGTGDNNGQGNGTGEGADNGANNGTGDNNGQGNGAGEGADNGANNGTGDNNGQGNGAGEGADNGANNGTGNNNGQGNGAGEGADNGANNGTEQKETTEADQCVAVAKTSIDWGVRESFRSYIKGPIAHGTWETTGATDNNGVFNFTGSKGSVNVKDSCVLNSEGEFVFAGHAGTLDLTIKDPEIRFTKDSGELVADVKSNSIDGNVAIDSRVALGALTITSLDVSDAAVSGTADVVVTAEGEKAFAGVYKKGAALDSIAFSGVLTSESENADCTPSPSSPKDNQQVEPGSSATPNESGKNESKDMKEGDGTQQSGKKQETKKSAVRTPKGMLAATGADAAHATAFGSSQEGQAADADAELQATAQGRQPGTIEIGAIAAAVLAAAAACLFIARRQR